MAFSLKGLVKIADLAPWADGSPPKCLYAYASADAQATIRFVDYFLPVIGMLKVGDVLMITAATGGTPLLYFAYVNGNTGTSIDITDGLQVTATDTD